MSYILDALRKADRERQGGRVPTIATAHAGPAPVRRPPWPWAVGGVLALSAVVFALLWAAGRPDPVREASVTAKSSRGETATPPPAPGTPASPPASVGDAAPSGPPVEHASARAEPVSGGVQGAPTEGPSIGLEPRGSSARVAPVAPPAKTPRAARAQDSPRSAPAPTGAPSSPEGIEAAPVAAALPRATPPSAAPGGSAIAERRLPGTPAPPAVVLAPGPLPDGGPGRAARPAPSEALARLTLDVLVYSEVQAERLVFINGRKYVEGQAVNGDAVLEQITPDGAILRHEDRRLLLRPKLNPYTRPGSP